MSGQAGHGQTAGGKAPPQRIDKWLWFVRVVKSRTLAAGLVTGGKVRVNRERVTKASATVTPGDVVTVTAHACVRVLKVLGPGTRRGPPDEAQLLYEDLTPPARPLPVSAGGSGTGAESGAVGDRRVVASGPVREAGAGRPTKRERRATDRLKGVD